MSGVRSGRVRCAESVPSRPHLPAAPMSGDCPRISRSGPVGTLLLQRPCPGRAPRFASGTAAIPEGMDRIAVRRWAAQLNPLQAFVRPLVAGLVLGAAGVLFESPPLAAVGGALLIVLSVRVAYDHRGAGRYMLPVFDAFLGAPKPWFRQQMTGFALFFLAVWLIVGSLRHELRTG